VSRVISWLLLVLLFGAFFAGVWLALQARVAAGKGMPAYSVFAEDRDGLAETARLLRKLGWEPVAVTRPIQQTHHRGLLILVEPDQERLSETDATAILHWVEKGNVLLLAGRRATALHRELHVSISSDLDAARAETPSEVSLSEAGGYTEQIDRLIVEGRDTLGSTDGVPLWWLDRQPGAVVLRRGAGRVLVLADPSLLIPRGLRRGDNVLFLYNVAFLHARDGRIYFDEYHHGLRSGGGFWSYLYYHDQQWTLAAVFLAAAVAAWSLAVRLGPPTPTPRERRADAVDYASAVARIYQLAGVHHLLARGLGRDFLTRLGRLLRLPRRALPAELLAAWRDQHPQQPSRTLEELLRGVSELRQREVPETRLLAWTRAFDRFLHEQGDSKARRQGDRETRRQGDKETRSH
jgi:hypothetical protein